MLEALVNPCYAAVDNSTASALPVGTAVKLASASLEVAPATAKSDFVVGFVAEKSIAANGEGQIYTPYGDAKGLVGAVALAKGVEVTVGASGALVVAAAGDLVCGVTLGSGVVGGLVAIRPRFYKK